MKIGMVLDESFPPDPRVENEAISLIAAGHEVHLFCLQFGSRQKERLVHKGIHLHRYGVPAFLRSLSALAYTLPLYHRLLKPQIANFIAESEVEALHIHDIRIARAVFWCNAEPQLPVVLDLHENRPEIMKYYAHVKSWKGRLLIYPSRWKAREYEYILKADRVVVVTGAARDYYVEETGKTKDLFTVVPNSVRKAFYETYELNQDILTRYQDSFTMLYLGDTGLRRGLKTAIAGMPAILEAIPNARLSIVGASKDDDTLKGYARSTGVEDFVDFHGWQDFSLFPSFILASDLGICPLHRNLHHDTTYANKIFQSMAFGKPVVVSNATAQARLVEEYECGEVFVEEDVPGYVSAILKLATEPDYYQQSSTNAKKAIGEALYWGASSQALIEMYASTLKKP